MSLRTIATAFGVACIIHVPAPLASQCLPASGLSSRVEQLLTPIARDSDSTSAELRRIYGLVHVTATQEIAYVSDSALCRTAAIALGGIEQPPVDYPVGVWVLKVGPTRYVVFDGTQYGAGDRHLIIFDSSFAAVGSIPF